MHARSSNRSPSPRRLALILPALALLAQPVAAQSQANPATNPAGKVATKAITANAQVPALPPQTGTPWLYKGSDIPPDREWYFGELPNGLRYAVRRNGVPPGQVAIRIRMDVGSLYEEDSERGYAHLLEHLVFRQSRYLGEAQAIPTWQRLGATFGSDTNAETGHVSTTYKLDLPNASLPKVDESLKLLSGMMIAPTLSEANVRTEVPIVLAEKRERGGAQMRALEATQATFYAGQRIATRSPIGTEATLQAASQTSVRAFHQRWYRPQNAVVIVSGDVDPIKVESQIRAWFSDWKVPGKPVPAPGFGDPVAPAGADPANPVGEARVVVEPDLPRSLSYGILRPWRPVVDTVVYNQGLMLDSLAQSIINRRLEAKARVGGSFLFAQVEQEDVSRSVDGTFVSITPLGEDWRKALGDVRAVIADALLTPPSQDEIDREAAEMSVAFESMVEQRRLQPGAKLADDIVRALDIRETVAAPETVLSIFNRSKPLFTPQAVLAHTQALFKGTVTRALYLTPKAGEGDPAGLRQALLDPVSADPKARLSGKPISFADMPPLGPPGEVPTTSSLGLLGIEQLEFANGVKVLLWPTRDEPGRVTAKVRFGAGYRAFGPGDAAYIALGNLALVSSGMGTLGMEELDRISTGRKMGFEFDIDEASFQFSADTRPADMADQLYLLASKFAQPRWDAAPVIRAKAAARLQYETYAASPQGVIERDLRFLQRGKDPRFHTPTPAEIAAATPEGFRQVWQPILQQGPIEVQLFGDFSRSDAVAALQRSFGALAPRPGLPAGLAPTRVQQPALSAAPVVQTHRGDANQAAAIISWPTGGGLAGISESRQLELLSDLFTNRLMEKMREKMGASYAPQVVSSWPTELDNGGSIMALAQLEPKAVPAFFAVADEIAADLIARPPSTDELERVVEPMRQQINRASSSSAFFMYLLEGASEQPARIGSLRTLLRDYTRITPEEMQALAARYLGKDRSWRLAVIPQGQQLATAVPAATPTTGAQDPAASAR